MDSAADDLIEDQEAEPVIRAGAAHRSDDIMLWVHFGEIIAEGFSVDPARDPDDKHPTVVLKRMTAQQLFDDLWAMGFRPEPAVYGKPVISCEIVTDALDRLDAVHEAMANHIADCSGNCTSKIRLVPPVDCRRDIEDNPIRPGRTLKISKPVTLVEANAGDVPSDLGPEDESDCHL